MADIFLSYARADRNTVEKLAADLQARGFSVWWDADIQSGEEFSKRIQAALDESKIAVVAWSKAAVESRWVRDEADYALQHGKLASVTIDGTPPPLGFRQFQSTDISRFASGDAAALTPLIEAMTLRLGEAPRSIPAAAAARPGAAPARAIARPTMLIGAAAVGVALVAVALYATQVRPGGKPPPLPEPPGRTSVATSDAVREASPQPAPTTVAVLPFIAMSASEQDGYFADGLTEEILNSLAAVPSLLVTARTSSFHFKGQNLPVPEIAAKLGVAYVVEGSLRPAGDRVRVTAQLIRASDGTHLWSDTYDRAAKDILEVQSEIAEQVAGALGVLLDEKTRRYMETQGVKSVEAFAAYQKGAALLYEAHAYGPFLEKAAAAQPEFAKASSLAPDFAEARLMHAVIYARLFRRKLYGAPLKPFPERSPEELHRLLLGDLDEAWRSARTPHRRVMIDFVRTIESDDWTGLGAKLDAALAGTECLGNLGWLSEVQSFGRLDALIAFMERRKACDPFDPGAYGTIMDFYVLKGDFAAARANIEKGRELFGQRPPYDYTEFLLELATRDFGAARAIIPKLRDAEWPTAMLAFTEGIMEAADLRPQIEALRRPDAPPDAQAIDLLVIAAWSGDRDEAARLAGEIDARPFGADFLMDAIHQCWCGAPFPLDAAPNFARRLEQAGLKWEPLTPIAWPAKDW